MFTIVFIVIIRRTFSNHLFECLLLCLSFILLQFLPDDEEVASLFTIVIDKDIALQEKKKKTALDMGRFFVSYFSILGSLRKYSTTVKSFLRVLTLSHPASLFCVFV